MAYVMAGPCVVLAWCDGSGNGWLERMIPAGRWVVVDEGHPSNPLRPDGSREVAMVDDMLYMNELAAEDACDVFNGEATPLVLVFDDDDEYAYPGGDPGWEQYEDD